jgi:TetR/AcrR family transcriptional regulator, transcriptional repressor for nem operon
MGRPRTFDPDEAVARAMLAFWQQGYVGTSWRELCAAMGIRSGSTHAAFGSKAALFARAVARYVDDQRAALGEPSPEAVGRWLDRVVAEREPRGCLLVASALEADALPPEAGAIVREAMASLDAFAWASLGGTPEAGADAAWLVATVTGLQVMHRAGTPAAHLSRIAARVRERLDIRAPRE